MQRMHLLAVWMYLRHQKRNAEDKVPIYVRVG